MPATGSLGRAKRAFLKSIIKNNMRASLKPLSYRCTGKGFFEMPMIEYKQKEAI